jgi:hypothetical protein
VRGDFQARFCERLRVKLPLPTRSQTRSILYNTSSILSFVICVQFKHSVGLVPLAFTPELKPKVFPGIYLDSLMIMSSIFPAASLLIISFANAISFSQEYKNMTIVIKANKKITAKF